MRLAFSFTAGLLAALNPCGFAMLPAYLSYFVGVGNRDESADTSRALARALPVGLVVSSGFVLFFLVVGIAVHLGLRGINTWFQYATIGIGAVMIGVGVAMVRGWKIPWATPRLDRGGKDRTLGSMFVFGLSYGVASLSCGSAIFIAVVVETATVEGLAPAVGNFLAYGLGMASLLMALTVAIALARQGLLRRVRQVLPFVDRAAGVFMILMGAYLVYYWLVNIATDSGTSSRTGFGIIEWVERLQSDITSFVNDLGAVRLGLAFGAVVLAACAVVVVKRSRRDTTGQAPTTSVD